MTYIVIYEKSVTIKYLGEAASSGYSQASSTTITYAQFAPFEDKIEATKFCKEHAGYVVMARGLVLEKSA